MLGQNIRVSNEQIDAPQSNQPENRPLPQITEKQAKRINTPIMGMVISTVVLVLITLPIYWLMPQPNKNPYRPTVDLPIVAFEASQHAGFPVVAPELEGWHYNFARWNSGQTDGIGYWQTGQVTPSTRFIESTQAKGTNPTWIANMVENAQVTGTAEIAGVSWEVRSLVDQEKKETLSYIAEIDQTTVILSGQASQEELNQLAEATVEYLRNPAYTEAPSARPSSGIL